MTRGDKDRYWFTPAKKYRLRSMVEVKKFLENLKRTGGDEVQAKKMMGPARPSKAKKKEKAENIVLSS